MADCCPNAKNCWRNTTGRKPARRRENGSVMFPWIGEEYEAGRGLIVLALNPNLDTDSDLPLEYGISWNQHHASLPRRGPAPAGVRARTDEHAIEEGRIERAGWHAQVTFLRHPTASQSDADYATLLSSLRARRR